MKDQLSALIDGEFDVENAEHLIKSVKSGGELKDCWQHYHLIGDAMRSEMVLSQGFTERVMNALNEEPIVLAPHAIEKPLVKTTFFKSNQIWSVAASVAAVMFVGLMLLQQQLGGTQDSSPVEIAQSMPLEYLEAHQAAAPSGAAYYIQNVNLSGAGQ